MRRPYVDRVARRQKSPMDRVGLSAKIPPSRRKINDNALQRMTCPLNVAQAPPGAEAPNLAATPAEVDRASLA